MKLCQWFNLKPGMRTARAVYVRDCLILAAGAELTASTIQRLPTWGIERLSVENPSSTSAASGA